MLNPCGSHSPPLAALIARVSETDVLLTTGRRLAHLYNTPPLGAGILFLAGQVLLDLGRVAGLSLVHCPQPVRRAHHRHRPAQQVDAQLLAFAQPVALLAHQLGPGLDDAVAREAQPVGMKPAVAVVGYVLRLDSTKAMMTDPD